jgi:hypothetical protein
VSVDTTNQYGGGLVSVILLTNMVEDWCRGSYEPIWWRIGVVDPTKQYAGAEV